MKKRFFRKNLEILLVGTLAFPSTSSNGNYYEPSSENLNFPKTNVCFQVKDCENCRFGNNFRSFKGVIDSSSDKIFFNHSLFGNMKLTSEHKEVHFLHLRKGVYSLDSNGELSYEKGKINVGVDYVVLDGSKEVKSWFNGTVVEIVKGGFFGGNKVTILTDKIKEFKEKKYPVFASYTHLGDISVKLGEKIKEGYYLGKEGNTGHSSSDHTGTSAYFYYDLNEREIKVHLDPRDKLTCNCPYFFKKQMFLN